MHCIISILVFRPNKNSLLPKVHVSKGITCFGIVCYVHVECLGQSKDLSLLNNK